MLPTREKALELLEEGYSRNPGPWKMHSINVARCAYTIAEKCEHLNPEKAYILGLLHDIGRREGVTHLAHVIDGYDFLMEQGYDEAAKVCLTHSFGERDMNCYIGNWDISEEDLKRLKALLNTYQDDDYDRLIQLCDSIAMAEGAVPIEVRMTDVKNRYGMYPQKKWDKNIEIKKYFEKLTGLDIDCLVLEI